ncbi:ATP-binding protein [Marimonas arenosa]|uniref:histidine kinase n=1 Tax=Marimonas arenosa TaxID=1795305 RepID=A0AAE4B4X9_9RHOB|nr:ATP-binding protein [Marimonas arenosa]MDQ2088611.1 ATP-binding protein [Marimonas arenosa]
MTTPTDPRQALLDALPMAACQVAPNQRIAALNAPGQALLGSGVAGQNYITALRQPDLLGAIERAAATHERRTARYVSRGGGQRDVIYEASCAWLGLLGVEGVLVCFEDRSPLEHAGQMRRDFVANVSHELRTPLTSLLGFIETLRGAARDDPAARDRFLDIMEAEAMRMERLVHDLLSLSRVEAQERMRPDDSVDLAAILASVLYRLAPLAEQSGIAFDLRLPEDDDAAVMVIGDEDQLRQLVANLVENAVKYGGAGGKVTLRLSRIAREPVLRSPAVMLEVIDYGAGIDPLHIPRLTERFYRVDSHRSRQVGGTGLGLAIVKHIVNRHRGRLRIDSATGKGSTFTVILPTA